MKRSVLDRLAEVRSRPDFGFRSSLEAFSLLDEAITYLSVPVPLGSRRRVGYYNDNYGSFFEVTDVEASIFFRDTSLADQIIDTRIVSKILT